MEFDLSFNFMSIFSIILLIVATITTVFQKLKLRWPVKVNCWFCNNNIKIWRQQLNWWMCPYCEQYNGFSKNGDYAYNIPEQYKTSSHEIKRYCTISQGTINKDANNGLCKQCNVNETIKISKLSDYIPENEKSYEYGIQKFKDSLEQQYPLCAKCKTTVNNVLHKQALWLAQYKMLFFKQKPFCLITNNTKYSELICRIISTILGSMIAYNMELIFLPIGGLFFQLCACWITSTKKQSSDILLMFLWICMIILLPFKDTKLIKADLHNTWFSLDYITQYHMIMLFISVIGFMNVMPKSHKSTLNKNMSFKKIEPLVKNTVLSNSYTTTSNNKHNFSIQTTSNLNGNIINQSALNTMKDLYMPCTENSLNCKSTIFQSSLKNPESQLSSMPINDNDTVFNSTPVCKKSMIDNSYSLNESLSTLSILSLGEDKPKYLVKIPKIFETKVYSTKSSELFKKSSKKNILSPPKLKSVMQTSWVAGGYWQEGIDAPSLSRSSSQSSGFGSAGSNFGPSREPSIHEFDQCSVISDTTQSCYTLAQSNSHVGSFCQRGLQLPLSEPKNQSVNNQTMKLASGNLYTPRTLLLSQNNKRNNSILMDQCPQKQDMNINDIKSPSKMQMFPSHTTVVTSPVWLPVLLCGSLVLNIIVLCTTLLR
ncbi:hypothetical protein WN48_06981 [Eufriesea mexicana]|uniref:Ima1 N-terminal domain-containing protein n=1 Tax=Eufriesea mexicana TaxID=516756 RepID=A0A310SVN8_9HYME|nr:PREDICTED: uncharacterized protein LOC108549844 [Eufriesea mexicana]OAD62243.1 hypothetical protein WN48_06981 [Eufriesea mexicana]